MAAAAPRDDIPIRLTVVEHNVAELKTGLDGHRNESRQGFGALQASLDRLSSDVAKRATPTNWYGFIGAAAATVMIIGSIFALAEWRVGSANAPLYEANQRQLREMAKLTDQLVELRIKQAVITAEGERVRIEQEARIRSRVESELRAPQTKQ